MTAERKRALLIIIATLIFGVLIGGLGAGLMRNQKRVQPSGWRKDGKEVFVQKILDIIEADSAQTKQIRPIILETIAKIDSIQKQTDTQVHTVLDSFEVKTLPILSEEQMERLRQFHKRNRSKE